MCAKNKQIKVDKTKNISVEYKKFNGNFRKNGFLWQNSIFIRMPQI